MVFNHKKHKAFTLAEIFIAMIILSALVAVCMKFFVSRHDYEREFFAYTAYRNLVNVVDSALMNDAYVKGTTPRTENTTCGVSANLKKCRAFKTGTTAANGLCSIFKDYFNTNSDSCGTTTNNPVTATTPALKLANGMEIHFSNTAPETIANLADATLSNADTTGYRLWVDINGHGQGEDKLHYDIFEYYITRSGKVVPMYGTVSGIRGYEFIPSGMDGGGNSDLISFDVIYSPEDNGATPGENHYMVVGDAYRSISFPKAACASGYLTAATPYCANFKYNCDSNGANCTTAVQKESTICPKVHANCKPRLVQKLKRLK